MLPSVKPVGDCPSCPYERCAVEPAQRAWATRCPPACDFAEAGIWAALGGGWQSLHGCFCQLGVSVEWHEFSGVERRDWSRSFHPDSVEICLNLSGHARLNAGGETALLGAMTCAVYHGAPGEVAAWRLPGQEHRFLTVEYSRAFLEAQLAAQVGSLLPVVRDALRSTPAGRRVSAVQPLTAPLRKYVETLRAPEAAGPARKVWYQAKAVELMAHLFFAATEITAPVSTRQKEVARVRVERAMDILTQRLAEPPSLEELGRLIGCSPYHLSRTFSKEMGMTIPQYLRQVRMERAAELLKSGRANVTEAALAVGYSSLSHFSQAFCETIGCCPGLYPLGLLRSQERPAVAAAGATQRQ